MVELRLPSLIVVGSESVAAEFISAINLFPFKE